MARLTILVAAILFASASPAAAADIRQGDVVTIGASETIDDDLYAFGSTVNILGTVRGSVIAAGETVNVNGSVTGDLMVAANTVSVRGQVGGSIRGAASTISIDGRINGDVLAAGNVVTVGTNARVGRDLFAGSGTTTLSGQVGRDVRGGVQSLTIDGRVGRDIRADVTTLRLTDRAVVEGSISYASGSEATIAPAAVVRGRVERREPERAQRGVGTGDTAIDWVRGLVGALVFAFLLLLLFPGLLRRSSESLVRSPWVSLGVGFGILIGIPILAIIVFLVGLLAGGAWIALVAIALYIVAIAVSIPVAALALGSWVLRRAGRAQELAVALALGSIVLLLAGVVPVIGGFIIFCAVLLGLGALTLAVARGRSGTMPARTGEA